MQPLPRTDAAAAGCIATHRRVTAIMAGVIEAVDWGRIGLAPPVAIRFVGRNAEYSTRYWRLPGSEVTAVLDLSGCTFHFGQRPEAGPLIGAANGRDVFLRCLPTMSNPGPIATALRRPGRARELARHEFTHLLDALEGRPGPLQPPRSEAEYFNDPFEHRAYLQNIAAPLLAVLDLAEQQPGTAAEALARLGGDFPGVLASLCHTAHAGPRAFLRHLDAANRASLTEQLRDLHEVVVATMGLDSQASPGRRP